MLLLYRSLLLGLFWLALFCVYYFVFLFLFAFFSFIVLTPLLQILNIGYLMLMLNWNYVFENAQKYIVYIVIYLLSFSLCITVVRFCLYKLHFHCTFEYFFYCISYHGRQRNKNFTVNDPFNVSNFHRKKKHFFSSEFVTWNIELYILRFYIIFSLSFSYWQKK